MSSRSLDVFLTFANEVLGKVMFLQVSVCAREGESLHDVISCLASWSHVPSGGSLSLVLCSFQGVSVRGAGVCLCPGESEKRAVCILLECFLVYFCSRVAKKTTRIRNVILWWTTTTQVRESEPYTFKHSCFSISCAIVWKGQSTII